MLQESQTGLINSQLKTNVISDVENVQGISQSELRLDEKFSSYNHN